ncbi:MAG: hypothetical protein RL699_791 [Bacteroidota bacterium]|jgi:hypothetical protein
MKRIASFALFGTLLLALTFSSCENEPVDSAINLNPVEPPVLPAAFRANFDGQTYIATQFNAVMNAGVLSISAYRGTQLQSFTLSINGTTTGIYPANLNNVTYSAGTGAPIFQSINPADAAADTGQVIITAVDEVNHTVSGTFSCTGYYDDGTAVTTKTFTNGVFTNIHY